MDSVDNSGDAQSSLLTGIRAKSAGPLHRTGAVASAGWDFLFNRHPLVTLLAIALLVRLPFAFVPSFHHPDEIYQYLEQAHRLATGYGVVPWEYRVGARNWVLPLLLAGPIHLTEELGLDGTPYIPLIRITLICLSLLVVGSFYFIGRLISPMHALISGFVGAVWFELVYFASHALSEPLSLVLFLPAAYLLYAAPALSWRRLVLAGFLLGLVMLIRFHLVPAIGILLLFTCGLQLRDRWFPVVLGGAAALALGGAVDLAMGTTPFQWFIVNFTMNLVEDRASLYGVSGPFHYFITLIYLWGTSTLIILPLACLGAKRYPGLFAAAIVNLLLHSLIGHKEYRFILLSTTLVMLLAAIGSADLARWMGRQRDSRGERLLPAAALALWLATSLLLATADRYRHLWTQNSSGVGATIAAARVPDLCGVATSGVQFWELGGYSYLHRRVPIFVFNAAENEALARSSGAFNLILAPADAAHAPPAAFAPVGCSMPQGFQPRGEEKPPICLYLRRGACSPGPHHRTINASLIASDE